MDVFDYCREEVRRQGHDLSNPHDGGLRVIWMYRAWGFARDCRNRGFTYPTVAQVVSVGQQVEPVKNVGGLRRVGVMVGDRMCPPPDEVYSRLCRLVDLGTDLQPLEWYKEYELIHPLVDGNGRSGKIWLNLLNGSLDDPIWPPADFWGHAILNP